MGRKSTTGARGPRMRWILLAGVVAIGAAGWLAHAQAKQLAARSLAHAFPSGDSRIGHTWFDANGDVVASDVVVYLSTPTALADSDAPDANTLRFERMRVRAPEGWMFYARNLIDMKLEKAQIAEWSIAFEGFTSRAGIDPSLGTLGPIGAMSASPFESEGCARHAYFMREELGNMGLKPGQTDFEVTLREDGNRVATRIVLSTPAVSRLQYDRVETLASPTSLLQVDKAATSTVSERWDVSDQGFVKARNTACARQDGVDEATFVARHVMSVQRLLETRGLLADDATIAAYRDFATNGGQLAFGGTYATALHSSERGQARANGSALLRMDAKLEHGSQTNDVRFSGTAPRALDTAGGATFAAMTKENGGATPVGGSVSTPKSAIPASTVAAGTPVRPQYASSLPSAAPAMAPGGRLEWDDLPALQGHLVQVFTMHNAPRTATLISVDANEAHVRARMPGGHADYRISREAFLRATLIQ
ncbi:hypothetical protein LF41_2532 [Lysobacter dokdonensis DS-58]|uniref:Uncharacterized protein n=1 Tax=Lysobacter dokdonensis DS-58 TaxID=1300345 RepID=A0A0A2X309_9GAMM|nr:hypothetical protein [Lysobacter dokdonensis]KGQ19594.1 hypothetical protein LF41_2532 [Lysobacter dokdonensis DS-58]